MKTAWDQFWQHRTVRERAIICAGVAMLTFGFAYAYVWLPVERDRARLMTDLPRMRKEAQQMRDDAREIERTRESARVKVKTAPRDLIPALSASASASQPGRSVPQVTAQADGNVRVIFPSVRVEDWLAWIATTGAYGAQIVDAHLERLDEAGLVKASATFSVGDR